MLVTSQFCKLADFYQLSCVQELISSDNKSAKFRVTEILEKVFKR